MSRGITTEPEPPHDSRWHELPGEEAARRLEVEVESGLSSGSVEERRERFGANRLEEERRRTLLKMFGSQFTDVMIVVLIGAALIAGALGEVQDCVAIAAIVVLNAIIGAVQEYRAERALRALRAMAAPDARVRRDSTVLTVPEAELVPGDIVLLEAGNVVPADIRLFETADLQIEESALTGESAPVEKDSEAILDPDAPVADRRNMAFKGTHVTRGRAIGITAETGMGTQLGHIADLLTAQGPGLTPLQRRLGRFGKRLAVVVLGVAGVVFALGLLRDEPVLVMFLTAVSLAVAAIPEALPAVITVSLAIAAKRLSRHNTLIRRLPAVETLGSVTTICADKTGTLTQNAMVVDAFFASGHRFRTLRDLDAPELREHLGRALALCNDTERDAMGNPTGEPTEVALAIAAAGAGFERAALEQELPRAAELPFSSERRAMTTLHHRAAKTVGGPTVLAYTKGAPEAVVPRCRLQLTSKGPEPVDPGAILAAAEALAADGCRVLAVAYREHDQLPEAKSEPIEHDLTLIGLVGLLDPPRDEVPEAIALCRSAGIEPVMITGDHPATAVAMAKRIGLLSEGDDQVLTGRELAALAEPERSERVVRTRVFARVDPEQKIAIVEALQAHGEFVAMTGDGVNDAPALERADIGVAMGRKGTDVAREAADMILVDDNFATIVSAVREGRRVFDNVRKFIKYTMTSNAGEIWTLLLAPFLGLPIPLLPIQILWINLVTDGLPGLAFAVEPEEEGIMQRPPRPPQETVFAHGMWQHMVWVGLLIGVLSIGSQAWAYHGGSSHWQTVVFTALTFSQLAHALVIRSERKSLVSLGLGSNLALLGAVLVTVGLQFAAIYTPFLQRILHTDPLTPIELLACGVAPLVVFLAVELEKALVRKGRIYGELPDPQELA